MSIYFKDRDGQTPLDPNLKGLKVKSIKTIGELDLLEESNIALGLLWLKSYRGKDFYSTKFLLELHKHLFNDVWSWAGKVRDIELNNPIFCDFFRVREELLNLERDVTTWLQYKTYPDEEITARYHHRLVLIHPFNNGNGRASRIATEYFSKRLNFKIPTWGVSLDPVTRRTEYLNGLRELDKNDDPNALITFIFKK
ncbi:MAG: hypothetical protein OHK0056_29810 [Bacteriovoracaceae bacterium]